MCNVFHVCIYNELCVSLHELRASHAPDCESEILRLFRTLMKISNGCLCSADEKMANQEGVKKGMRFHHHQLEKVKKHQRSHSSHQARTTREHGELSRFRGWKLHFFFCTHSIRSINDREKIYSRVTVFGHSRIMRNPITVGDRSPADSIFAVMLMVDLYIYFCPA